MGGAPNMFFKEEGECCFKYFRILLRKSARMSASNRSNKLTGNLRCFNGPDGMQHSEHQHTTACTKRARLPIDYVKLLSWLVGKP